MENCSSSKYSVAELPELQLNFGNGGGFTGTEHLFVLLKNGQAFKQNSLSKETTELPNVKRKLVKDIFKQAESLDLNNLDINTPGNMYKFIELKLPGIASKRLSWGSPDNPVDEKIESLYTALTELVKEKPAEEN